MIRTIGDLTLLLYVAAMAFAFLDGGFRRKALHLLCLASASAAFVLHAASLTAKWKESGVIPSVNAPQLMELTVFFLMLTYFVSGIFARQREILFFLTTISVLLMMTAGMLPQDLPETKPYFTTFWFPLHILSYRVRMSWCCSLSSTPRYSSCRTTRSGKGNSRTRCSSPLYPLPRN